MYVPGSHKLPLASYSHTAEGQPFWVGLWVW